MSLQSMAALFKRAGFDDYKKMEIDKFYDISDKKLYTPSYNEKTQKVEPKKITALVYKGEWPVWEMKTRNGEVLLRATEEHRLYDVHKKDYVFLGELYEKDEPAYVMTKAGEEVEAFAVPTLEKEDILDIQVDGNSNYFTNGILSHNTGGFALKYAGSTLMRVKKIESIVQDSKDIGIHMLVRNFKNKTGVPNRQCEMDLYFLNGFDSTIEYVDFIKDFVEDPRMIPVMKAGAGGTYKSEKWNYSQRGRDNFIADIKKPEYAEMWLDIKTTIDQILANPGNELDKQRMTEDQMDDEEKSIAQELKLAERQEKVEGAVGDADSASNTVLCEEDEVQS